MFCVKVGNNLINKIHKHSLYVVHEIEDTNFEDLLRIAHEDIVQLPVPTNHVKHVRCLF